MENKQKSITEFKNKIIRLPKKSSLSYNGWGYRQSEPVAHDFTIEEIETIIRTGDLISLRELSRYYYRTNSAYRNNIDFLAHLPLYETLVIPQYIEGKVSDTLLLKTFHRACEFIDSLDLPNALAHITTEWLKNGIYYGILREEGELAAIQDLPINYCRSRFKDIHNLDILEFNLNYFYSIADEEARQEAVLSFPKEIQKAWRAWIRNAKKSSPWVAVSAANGGISFSFAGDATPLLIASIPELKKLNDAIAREEKRDDNELHKLLIQKMPIDSNGQLVFELEEVADMHAAIAAMLEDLDTVDVLTTFGDTSLESLQESSSATQSSDRIAKYKNNAWDALGRGSILFNPEGSSALSYMLKKDETLMNAYLNVYETWLHFLLNERFARKGLTFDFQILPLTVFNREELQTLYFRGAQYGYSKMYAGVAMGMKQKDQLSLMNFENDVLKMSIKMVPLQSSYTTSGTAIQQEEKTANAEENTTSSTQIQDVSNTGGRPTLSVEKQTEKTQSNNDSMK